jgi:hypothetical protein
LIGCRQGWLNDGRLLSFNSSESFLSNKYQMASASSSAAASAGPVTGTAFPSGAWTLYFHAPDDTNWTPASYYKIGTFRSFETLWGALRRIDAEHFLTGMFFLMRDPFPPMWEHRSNIHGGTYCIKVPEAGAHETFQRYAAASILDAATSDARNTIVGVSISPKKGFHILKVWNNNCKSFHAPSELLMLGDGLRHSDVLYRPHVDQKF